MLLGAAAFAKGVQVATDRMGREARERLAREREAYRQEELTRIRDEVRGGGKDQR